MQTYQGNMYRSLRAVKEFLELHALVLDGIANTEPRRQLDELIAELEADLAAQEGNDVAAQLATRNQQALRAALKKQFMRPISRVARIDLPHTPGSTPDLTPLRMPKRELTTERLAAAARGMAEAATPYVAKLVAAGMPADVIARFKAAIDAMLKSVTDRVQMRGRQSGATTSLRTKLAKGRRIVHAIDTFVQVKLEGDGRLLSHWNRIKRVTQTAARSQDAAATPAPMSTSTTSPAGTPAAATSTNSTAPAAAASAVAAD
jgi:hypothetical protein